MNADSPIIGSCGVRSRAGTYYIMAGRRIFSAGALALMFSRESPLMRCHSPSRPIP